jgi:hypothetical protein
MLLPSWTIGLRNFSICRAGKAFASALASIKTWITDTGLYEPCVRNELNSPSVTNP